MSPPSTRPSRARGPTQPAPLLLTSALPKTRTPDHRAALHPPVGYPLCIFSSQEVNRTVSRPVSKKTRMIPGQLIVVGGALVSVCVQNVSSGQAQEWPTSSGDIRCLLGLSRALLRPIAGSHLTASGGACCELIAGVCHRCSRARVHHFGFNLPSSLPVYQDHRT